MVKILRTLLVLLFFTLSSELFAQVNEVTLVTSGEGATENDAVNEALRSAIEQAYGVFVSANTDILNDELVKDEIVTVSSGNIHSYKKLGCVELANGNKSVSVEATVSVSNLVSFAQSKGASCEFAGAVFGANLKLINLNKANAEKAIEHLYTSLESVAATMYDYEVEVGQPKSDGTVEITAIAKANENYKTFTDMVYNTLKSLSVNNVEQLKEMGVAYTKAGLVYPSVYSLANVCICTASNLKHTDLIYTLFNLENAVLAINRIQKDGLFNFVVKDSNDNTYSFENQLVRSALDYDASRRRNFEDLYSYELFMTPEYGLKDGVRSLDLQEWAVRFEEKPFSFSSSLWSIGDFLIFIPKNNEGCICLKYKKTFKIPVEKLVTISGFTIERKVK